MYGRRRLQVLGAAALVTAALLVPTGAGAPDAPVAQVSTAVGARVEVPVVTSGQTTAPVVQAPRMILPQFSLQVEGTDPARLGGTGAVEATLLVAPIPATTPNLPR